MGLLVGVEDGEGIVDKWDFATVVELFTEDVHDVPEFSG